MRSFIDVCIFAYVLHYLFHTIVVVFVPAPAPKHFPKYKDDMPSVQLYFRKKWKQGMKQQMK